MKKLVADGSFLLKYIIQEKSILEPVASLRHSLLYDAEASLSPSGGRVWMLD